MTRALLALGCLALASCGSLLGLDDLQKVDCTRDCGGTESGGASSPSSGTSSAGSPASSGAANGGASSMTAGSGGSSSGAASSGSAGTSSDAGSDAGGAGASDDCGGDEPPLEWSEHWYEHDQQLSRASFSDCVAVYGDPDMAPADVQWLGDFVRKAWAYNLEKYGRPSDRRLFAIFHQSKYDGGYKAGHSAAYYEASHDFRNVLDAAAQDWTTGDYDMPAHLLSFVLEFTAVKNKQGSPASWIWSTEAFGEIYKYDLYVGLGMTEEAEAAFDRFEPIKHVYPVPESYWFADFYYPVWRDYGKTQVLVNFFKLLEQHYPATDGVMGDMSWGEYIHFMSGAAGHEVQTQATYAFGWFNEWQAELEKARGDYPQISY